MVFCTKGGCRREKERMRKERNSAFLRKLLECPSNVDLFAFTYLILMIYSLTCYMLCETYIKIHETTALPRCVLYYLEESSFDQFCARKKQERKNMSASSFVSNHDPRTPLSSPILANSRSNTFPMHQPYNNNNNNDSDNSDNDNPNYWLPELSSSAPLLAPRSVGQRPILLPAVS